MPTITRARPDAHAPHDDHVEESPPGWCLPCYEAGQAVLAATPESRLCALHETRGRDAQLALPRRRPRSRPPRGIGRQALAYGRRRAARRVAAGRFAVHPGWRNRVPTGRVVLTDQPTALARAGELVDDELWRADRRQAWLALCRALVAGMDWRTGLVTGLTRQQLAERTGVSVRTVSRLLAWAQHAGLLVCVETGATAAFLGTDRNRAPAYVFTRPAGIRPLSPPPQPVEQFGNPPASCVGEQPLGETRGLKLRPNEPPRPPSWPARDRPRTAPERTAATQTLLQRIGLTGHVSLWRTHGLLTPWWHAGACLAGLLHAIDHHPDQPHHTRGDALRAARDPLRVIGHRLAPWRGRLDELPAALQSVDPDARRARAAHLAAQLNAPPMAAGDTLLTPGAPTRLGAPTFSARPRPARRAAIDEARRIFASRGCGGDRGDRL